MPVTFAIASHAAEAFTARLESEKPQTDVTKIADKISGTYKPENPFQSSFDSSRGIIVRRHGFVHGILLAYNQHHNIVIRPDDVWIAILSQLSTYVTTNAENLRDKFVAHELGKKDLILVSDAATIEEMDFGQMAVGMTGLLGDNLKDKSLIPWVLPNFSTTTTNDTIICSAIVMATLREYFGFEFHTKCGIPFVTLEGTKADWQSILNRIERLPEFGEQPAEWAEMLRAILCRFVRAFDHGGPEVDKEFWDRIIHEESASGTYFISGWMSAFCAWDAKGAFFGAKQEQSTHGWSHASPPKWVYGLTFDGVWFPRVGKIPKGYTEVDIKVKDTAKGQTLECVMIAGHVGISLEGKEKLDTIRMAPQWFMFSKGEKYNETSARRKMM